MQISTSFALPAKISTGLRKCVIATQTPYRKLNSMSAVPDVAGLAALAICESLLLALNDRKVLPETEIVGILEDAAAAHENVPAGDLSAATHTAVAALINKIIDGGNSVRRH
jgi:hypothetical protein